MAASDLQKQLQEASEAFGRYQTDLNKTLRARQQLETQLAENTSVKEELGYLEATAKVFKQVGPVLIPQDLEESRSNVQKRLDWITCETKRIDGSIKDLQSSMEKQRDLIMKIQQSGQAASKAPRK